MPTLAEHLKTTLLDLPFPAAESTAYLSLPNTPVFLYALPESGKLWSQIQLGINLGSVLCDYVSSKKPHLFATVFPYIFQSFPGGSEVKVSATQCGRPGFNPWVGKIPWRRKWQPTPVLLPGESHGQRSLVGYSPQGHKESDTTERLHFHFHFSIYIGVIPPTQ